MPIIFFLILLIIDLYIYFGTSSTNIYLLNIPYKYIYIFLSFIAYSILIFFQISDTYKYSNELTLIKSFVFIIFISKIIGLGPLIIDDIIRIFKCITNLFNVKNKFDYSRLEFLQKSSIIATGIIFSSLLGGIFFGRYKFKKNKVDIYINNWPKKIEMLKIIHISDLHLGSFNSVSKLEEIVELINEENPDLIFFTGDLVNDIYQEAIPFLKTLQKLKATHGKFSVLGNHDYGDYVFKSKESEDWKINFKNMIEIHKQSGFELLLNDYRKISIKNSELNIVGVENWGSGRFSKYGDLNKAMNKVNDNIPTFLLSHDPSHWREIVLKSKYKIDLQLSGHTHGMQFGIEIPGFKWSPVQYKYKEWAGLYKKDDSLLYVNRGLGSLGYSGRVGIMPDISILSIKEKI